MVKKMNYTQFMSNKEHISEMIYFTRKYGLIIDVIIMNIYKFN